MSETYLAFPVVTAGDLEEFLYENGIKPWQALAKPISLTEYLSQDLSHEQRTETHRFAPQPEVMILQNPHTEKPWTGFRMAMKNFALTMTCVPHPIHDRLVLVVAEWKHGMEQIGLTFPAGVAHQGERASVLAAREYTEETGLLLDEVIQLGRSDGYVLSGRNNTQRYFPYLGKLHEPIEQGPLKLDENEQLIPLLIPYEEWLGMCGDTGSYSWTIECSTVTTTFLGTQKLGLTHLLERV